MAYFLPHIQYPSPIYLTIHSVHPCHISKYPPPSHSQQSILGVVVTATAASALLASNAMAIEVLLGSSDRGLAFVPSTFSVAPGEEIIFKNNVGFPHNLVFDEDKVPSCIDVAKILMSEKDLLIAPGETYKVSLKGTYSFYCSPHQGAEMSGKVTVN